MNHGAFRAVAMVHREKYCNTLPHKFCVKAAKTSAASVVHCICVPLYMYTLYAPLKKAPLKSVYL
jgi:hypothetical protein